MLSQGHHHHQHDHSHDEPDAGRLVRIEQELLGKNNAYAMQNRAYFKEHNIFVLNLVSSPGAGKTTLLVETIKTLKDRIPIAVIEGDQQTEHDADRIRATGTPAVQINTGRACHLDAHGIGHAVMDLGAQDNSLLAIENVGNLVCPSSFDLGEAHKVVVLSVTEGDDKPLKYPDMFHAADLMLINKTDLLPYVDFDIERCIDYARRVNPDIQIIRLSSTQGENFSAWTDWLLAQMQALA
ncbi:hydrogenase nickel incorporation protein HypB [Methylomicrobium lacus]|uniref:hydrogenase nickel incorporation protein HypB n=1 Tax=Methylomicrobium lacus TaxID=136992 RepID=UPI00045E8060